MRQSSRDGNLCSGPVGRTLFRYALPVMISQLLQEFYNIADCAVVGRFGGSQALSAAGLAGLILSVLINFFIGFSSGVSVISSRLYGAGRFDELFHSIDRLLKAAALTGLVLSIFGEMASAFILSLLGTPPETLGPAALYLRICFLGLTAQLLSNLATALLRSMGDSASPMLMFLLSSVCNLILDVWLVVGLKTGVAGAAAATVISQYLMMAGVLAYLLRKMHREEIRCGGRKDECREPTLGDYMHDAWPAGMQALFMSASSLVLQVFINSFGSAAVAGMTVYARAEGFLYFPAFAYGIALTGFVGQNVGAGKPERIVRAVRLSAAVLSAYVAGASVLLILTRHRYLQVFTADAAILANASQAIAYIFPVYVIYALNQVLLGAVKGLGDTRWPMVCTLVCYGILRVVWCSLLLERIASMAVVYLSYDVSFFVMLAMILPAWRRKIRKAAPGIR